MVERHLEETKRLIIDLANKIMLNDDDLVIDKKTLAPIRQLTMNMILQEYLSDLANDRISDLEVFINDENIINKYVQELIIFLQDTISERI